MPSPIGYWPNERARFQLSLHSFLLSLWQRGPGERIALEVMRDNELKRLDVTGGDRADFYKQIP